MKKGKKEDRGLFYSLSKKNQQKLKKNLKENFNLDLDKLNPVEKKEDSKFKVKKRVKHTVYIKKRQGLVRLPVIIEFDGDISNEEAKAMVEGLSSQLAVMSERGMISTYKDGPLFEGPIKVHNKDNKTYKIIKVRVLFDDKEVKNKEYEIRPATPSHIQESDKKKKVPKKGGDFLYRWFAKTKKRINKREKRSRIL